MKKIVTYRVEHIARKEKLLVTSNFSFSHKVLHSYISLMRRNAILCGNELTASLNARLGLTCSEKNKTDVGSVCYSFIKGTSL